MLSIITLSACSRQAWYESAKSAQQADCLRQPASEYDDCKAPASDSYIEYEKKRKQTSE